MDRSIPRYTWPWLCVTLLALFAEAVAQSVSPLPYDPRLLSDPNVGNVQGLQRFGRQLRTDPEMGMGYGYQVFPRWVLGSATNGGVVDDVAGRMLTRLLDGFSTAQSDFLDDPEKHKTSFLSTIKRFENALEFIELQLPESAKADLDELRNVLGRFRGRALRIKTKEDVDDGTRNLFAANLGNMARLIGRLRRLRGAAVGTASSSPRTAGAFAQPFSQTGVAPFGHQPPVGSAPHFFNPTAGMRNPSHEPTAVPAAPEVAGFQPFSEVVTFNSTDKTYETVPVFHQPLIQVKVRVVEVARGDSLQVSTVLDYIGGRTAGNSLINGGNINNNAKKTSAVTRFPAPIGIDPDADFTTPPPGVGIEEVVGNGALINLTHEHINLLTSLLAAEFNADVITAPEVVTLNGQNVEFISGEKLPFALGLTMVQSDSATTTNFVYKDVGTYISVTPRIVNWGKHAELRGTTPIVATEIASWNGLIDWMLDGRNLRLPTPDEAGQNGKSTLTRERLLPYAGNNRPVPYDVRRDILLELSQYPGDELRQRLGYSQADPESQVIPASHTDLQGHANRPQVDELPNVQGPAEPPPLPLPPPAELEPPPARSEAVPATRPLPKRPNILKSPTGMHCDWRPEECTIDLEILVRLSDKDDTTFNIELQRGDPEEQGTRTLAKALAETDIRAVANVLQVKSGHGVAMAGLIGLSDTEVVAKVPVLGDVPLVGYLFRSKQTTREKTETLIFVEAKVLPTPDAARYESARDFGLGQPFVSGPFLENPLEVGMYRAGFGAYLPPHSHQEDIFWERFARKVRKASTQIDDAFE